MTTRRTHTCELCRDGVVDGTGVGIKFGMTHRIELTVPSNAETHLCQKCIDALQDALREQRAAEEARAAND